MVYPIRYAAADVLPSTVKGMMEASATIKFLTPCTLPLRSTTPPLFNVPCEESLAGDDYGKILLDKLLQVRVVVNNVKRRRNELI